MSPRRAGRGPGTATLLAGLAAVAVSGYVWLGLAGRAFGPEGAAALSVLWTVANAVGAGLFVPVEQELARRVAARDALGRPDGPAVRTLAAMTAALTGLLALAGLALAVPVADGLFGGDARLVGCLLLTCAGFAAQHVTRGVFAGRGRFDRYGRQLLADAAVRAGGAVALTVAGAGSVLGYGVVLAAAPAGSVLLSVLVPVLLPLLLPGRFGPGPGPAVAAGPAEDASGRAVAGSLALVVTGQTLSTAIIGAGPVAVALLAGPGEAAAAGVVIGVLLVTRAPLLGFYAVQATMLPALARLVAVGDLAGVRRRLATATGALLAVGTAATLAAVPLGPWAMRLVLGPGFRAGAGIVVLLVAAVFVYILAAVTAQALLAVDGHRASALAWAGGAAAYLLVLLRPADVASRVGLAFLASGLTALVLAAVPLLAATRPSRSPQRPRQRPQQGPQQRPQEVDAHAGPGSAHPAGGRGDPRRGPVGGLVDRPDRAAAGGR